MLEIRMLLMEDLMHTAETTLISIFAHCSIVSQVLEIRTPHGKLNSQIVWYCLYPLLTTVTILISIIVLCH